jgi:hypothetical protein
VRTGREATDPRLPPGVRSLAGLLGGLAGFRGLGLERASHTREALPDLARDQELDVIAREADDVIADDLDHATEGRGLGHGQ